MIVELADRLKDALSRERDAIVALDTASLATLEREKLSLLEDLKSRLGASKDDRELLAPILIDAEINAILLRDVVSAMSSLLGISETGVYDRGAKTSRSTSSNRRRVA